MAVVVEENVTGCTEERNIGEVEAASERRAPHENRAAAYARVEVHHTKLSLNWRHSLKAKKTRHQPLH